MTLSVRLSDDEETLLEQTARRLGRSKSDLARQAVGELCRKLNQHEHDAFSIGKDLFGAGELAEPPTDLLKRKIWENIREKHGSLG